ncbi:TonB system transport protein ExbD [Mesorhizobium sp. WSM3224]|uniref:TonB system transport protein ExbD n=1 Tax=Mesorhizobium sp. WSM3224 TaxID=1040986 RepID=UPI0004224EBB|nr:TonB system transport protein ExbD [Mesorhizobium sp. WSM3224]
MAARIRETSGDDLEESHDINVTPFIDVILVLLIIFMVAAPLATVDVSVDLPGSTATPAPRPETPLFLTLKSDLTLAIGNDSVPRPAFAGVLDGRTRGDKQTRIFLRADRKVGYGDLMEVMNLLRAAGYLKVALVGLETVSDGAGGEAMPPAAGANPAPGGGQAP